MKLTNDDAIKILRNHRKDSFGPNDKQLTRDRSEAMDRYHGRLYGDEEEGYSQFVTKDLAENVDWAMPSILRPFIQSGTLAEFKPRSKEDEEKVQLESDYTNYVIMEDNDGFLMLHDVVKDMLILRNGYVKHDYQESKDVMIREWSDINYMELMIIKQNIESEGTKFEVLEQDDKEDGKLYIKAKLTYVTKGIVVEPVPVEELRVSNNCRGSLKDSDYVGYVPRKTRSDLIEMGISKKWLDTIESKGGQGVQGNTISNTESAARDKTSDETDNTYIDLDVSMQDMDYAEEYVRMDFDGDGIAELRKIITVSDKIPPGKEWNQVVDSIPFTGGAPKRMPHRHIGESFNDDLADLAEQHTTLTRMLFDNTYKTLNNQWAINDRVDEEDFLDQGPGATFRVDGEQPINGSIEAIRHDSIAQHLLPVISHVEEKKKKRTGVNEGDLDPDILKQATKGAFMEDLNRKSQKIEMTTRMIAETFVKELVINVHALIIKHQLSADSVKLGGEFQSVDPLTWKPRKHVAVKVGLGTGNAEERVRKLTLLKGLQAELIQMGLVTPEEAYSLYVDIAKELGEVNPEKYVVTPDPQNPKYQQILQRQQQAQAQGQQNPLAEAEKIKGEFKLKESQMTNQFKGQMKQMEEMNRMQMDNQKEQNKQMIEMIRAEHKRDMEAFKAQMDLTYKREKIMSDETMKAAELETEAFIANKQLDVGKPGIGAGLQDE